MNIDLSGGECKQKRTASARISAPVPFALSGLRREEEGASGSQGAAPGLRPSSPSGCEGVVGAGLAPPKGGYRGRSQQRPYARTMGRMPMPPRPAAPHRADIAQPPPAVRYIALGHALSPRWKTDRGSSEGPPEIQKDDGVAEPGAASVPRLPIPRRFRSEPISCGP